MREVYIDLSSDNYLQQPSIFGGYAGEHRETVLRVKLPERMINIECSGYRFDFQTSDGNKILSPLIPVSELDNNTASFYLTEQLTVEGKLLFNISAVQSNDNDENTVYLIAKTNVVVLYIKSSTEGNNVLPDPNGYKDELFKMVDERIKEINPANVDQTYDPASANAQSGTAVAEAIATQPKQIPEITSLTLSDETPLGVYILKRNSYIKYVSGYDDIIGPLPPPFSGMRVSSDTLINISKIPTLGQENRLGIRVMLLSEVTEFDSVVPIERKLGYIEYWKEPKTGYPATGTITYYNYATTDDVAEAISDVSTSKVDKLERGNLLVGMDNIINIKGYKMLSITPSTPSESDATKCLQLDIEVNDKDLEEKAASSYATKDLVIIVASTHWVDAYAIYALSTNENGNSIISVRPYSVINNKFTGAVVDNIAIDSDTSDTENWIYVDGKSFGTPVLRTQGATLTGEQNTSVGRYTFGSGRQNKILDDGGVGVGRQNTVGYLAFAQGRGNKVYNGSAFGGSNIIEWNNSSVSFVTGSDNRIYRNSKGNLVSGHTNTLSSGTFNTVLGGSNSTNGTGSYNLLSGKFNLSQDGNHSGAVGNSNKIYSGECNFAVGHDNHLRGKNNLSVGTSNDLLDTASNNILVGQNLSGKYPYQAIFGKRNEDDADAVAIFAYPDDAKPNYSRNVATVDKNGNIKALGDVTSKGVNITQQSNSLTNWMYALMRNIGESATITTVVKANARVGYSVVEGVEYISVTGAGNSKIGYVSVSEGDVIFIQSLNTLYGNTWTPPSVGWYLTDSCDGLTESGVTNIKIIQKDDTSHGADWITYSNVAIVVPAGANYLIFGYKNATTPQIKILKTTLGDKIGDIDTALDNIIALQNSYIGGNT